MTSKSAFLSPPVPLPTMTAETARRGTWKPRSLPGAALPSARLENGSGGGGEGQGSLGTKVKNQGEASAEVGEHRVGDTKPQLQLDRFSRRVSGPPPGCPQAGVFRLHPCPARIQENKQVSTQEGREWGGTGNTMVVCRLHGAQPWSPQGRREPQIMKTVLSLDCKTLNLSRLQEA